MVSVRIVLAGIQSIGYGYAVGSFHLLDIPNAKEKLWIFALCMAR